MDISALDLRAAADEGFTVRLTHPVSDEPLEHDGRPMTIEVYGKDSTAFRAIRQRLIRKYEKSKKASIDLDAKEREASEIVAECTIGGSVYADGKWIKVNPDNALDIYLRFPWIREQVDVAMNDRENLRIEVKKS